MERNSGKHKANTANNTKGTANHLSPNKSSVHYKFDLNMNPY